MALPPKPIYTRRRALVEEFGYDSNNVASHGFDADGFEVVVTSPDGQFAVDGDRIVTTRIEWPDSHTRQRAKDAMVGDFAEMIGMTPDQWLKEEARLRGLARSSSSTGDE
jgi:hypothetical protein